VHHHRPTFPGWQKPGGIFFCLIKTRNCHLKAAVNYECQNVCWALDVGGPVVGAAVTRSLARTL